MKSTRTHIHAIIFVKTAEKIKTGKMEEKEMNILYYVNVVNRQ